MISKVNYITQLYEESLLDICKSSEEWMKFLTTLSNNYNYSFNNQVLIYMQKPQATACTDITTWNNKFNRWVNRGAKGIATLEEKNGNLNIRYVFDVIDTNGRYFKKWYITKSYENEISKVLKNNYMKQNDVSFSELIMTMSKFITNENISEYYKSEEPLNKDNFYRLLSNSVAYAMLNRCGIDSNEYFKSSDFNDILNFNDYDNITNLGVATSEITKIGLEEIYQVVKKVRINESKKNRTFDNEVKKDYAIDDKGERRDLYEQNNLSNERGLSNTQFNSTREQYPSGRQIRNDEIRILEKEQEISIYNIANEQSTSRTFDEYSKNSNGENRTDSIRDENKREDNRTVETTRSYEMGRANEQLEDDSRGNSNERIDLRLNNYNKDESKTHYVVVDEKINQILSTTPHLRKSNKEIKEFIRSEQDITKKAEYLKGIFNNDYTGVIVDDQMYGYKTYDNGILFWKGNFLSRDTESFVSWEDLTYHYDAMILLNQLNDRIEPLPSVTDQLSLLDDNSEKTVSDLEFTQEFVDKYLTEQHRETKFSIYEFFQKSLSTDDNINYLKNLYGISGSTSTVRGAGIGVNTDYKGVKFNRGYFDKSSKEQLFKWNYIEKRIKILIHEDRYLNAKELAEYTNWLDKKEQEREFIQASDNLAKMELVEPTEEQYDYQYHLGDKVYIGADEYEILSIEIANVVLYDYQYPLFNREMSKEEFDRKVKENPANDHLKVKINDIKDNIKEEQSSNTDEIEKEEISVSIEEENIAPVFEKKRSNMIRSFDIHPDVPITNRNQFKISNDNLGVGTPREKFNRNVEAIKVLKKCEEENRFATPEEQEILSQYGGWGGLPQAFDELDSSWSNEYHILKKLLDEQEYSQARESTLTSFYTPPVVIRSMYKALENMGLKTGNVLEPSCGVGNFIGMIPDSLENCKLYGVELDSISGRIARQLYQKSTVAVQGYEDTNLPNSFFDVAVGNVPFGDFRVLDKKYDKHKFLIHDYFFAKTLDKVRPGGVIAFITSKGTLDKENPSVRKYIAQRADLLGAIRLPNNTFKANAGTEATADIIFLQKRDSITDIEPDWVYLGKNKNGIKMNQYFIDNPYMVMGNMEMIATRFGYDSACISDGENLEDKLERAISNIHAEVKEYELDDIVEDNFIEADLTVRNFSYTLIDDKVYFRENSRMYPQEVSESTKNRIKGLIEIRDCVRTLIEYQTEDYPDEDIKREQVKLNKLYDEFTKKYGLISSRGNNSAFSNDSSYYLLCSLEILDENGNLARKADMFTKRTIKPKTEITSVDNANDALIVSLSEKARVDIAFMQKLCNIDMDKMLKDLEGEIFNIPEYGESNKWVTADEYLSGNVREKLKIAEEFAETDDRFKVNVKYLKEVQPKDLSASEISVRLGSTWIPESDIKDFIRYLLNPNYYTDRNIKVHYMESTSEWNIEGKSLDKYNVKSTNTYGTKRANAYKIIEDSLNLRDTRVYDYYTDENGKRVAELNKKETAIAQAKQEQIKLAFDDWIWKDPERRERLTKIYNERFNSIRPREYDGSHISFDGMNPEITLRKHQVNAIARILYGGNTLLAHEVGAGKTFEMVAASMESKRLGLCNKSLFVVPNHIIEQFGKEFLQLYPSANILITTKKDFTTANRKKFCSRIATGDYDAIIISHSQFEKIPMSIERQATIIQKQIDDIILGIQDLKNNNGERFSIKQMEKTKKSLETRLAKLNDASKKDDVVTFEELGVDRIFVDEAHYYKNLFLYTKMRNVGGIAQTEAQKSSDLFMKCRYLDELTGGKGVIFATGTPISNSMVELYTMQRYLQYSELEKRHLQQFDAWASTFGETVTAIELSPEGTGYRAKTRFAKFFNLPELMAMFREVADIQTSDTLNLPVPKANYHNIVIEASEVQKKMVEDLSKRADQVRNKMVKPDVDNMLRITNDGRKLALDQRIINDMLPDEENGKISECANKVYEIWNKTSDKKSAQLVFCDLSTPNNDGKFNAYDDLKTKLIKRGIPEEEIKFIHDAKTDTQRQEMFNSVRKGQVRVLIGSTTKMGAGTNCQDKLIALHDVDCPWRPSDLTQRSGRIIRQGNENDNVDIYRYVTEGTFDAYLYQLVENKQKFISQIMTSKIPVRDMEDIDETALSYAEIKALAAGNPDIIEKTELDTQVAKLKLLKQNHLSQIYELEDKVIKYYPTEIKRLENRIECIKADLKILKNNNTSDSSFEKMYIKGTNFTEKKLAGERIIKLCKSMTNPDPIEIGEYKGFNMILSFDTFYKTFYLDMKNNLSYRVELGGDANGNITRIDNVLNSIEERLSSTENTLEDTKKNFENAKQDMNRPFPQEDELKQKIKRLDELNIKLNLSKEKDCEEDKKSQTCKKEHER